MVTLPALGKSPAREMSATGSVVQRFPRCAAGLAVVSVLSACQRRSGVRADVDPSVEGSKDALKGSPRGAAGPPLDAADLGLVDARPGRQVRLGKTALQAKPHHLGRDVVRLGEAVRPDLGLRSGARLTSGDDLVVRLAHRVPLLSWI